MVKFETHKKLILAKNECMKELDTFNIPYDKLVVITPYTSTSYLGVCCRNAEGSSLIKINELLLQGDDDESFKGLKATIIHELLHTAFWNDGHRGLWKVYANKMNNKFGYNIQTTSSFNASGVSKTDVLNQGKYACRCKQCGNIVVRQRMSDFIKYYPLYKCSVCNGSFERIK